MGEQRDTVNLKVIPCLPLASQSPGVFQLYNTKVSLPGLEFEVDLVPPAFI